MKTRIFLTLMVLGSLSGLRAQTTDVQQGIPTPFAVTQTNSGLASTYTWTPDVALSTSFDNTTTGSVTITFNGVATTVGNISVYATANATSCQGNTQTRAFRIVSQMTVSADFSAISAVCPAIGTGTGDIDPTTVSFIDPTNSNAPIQVTGFRYQLVDQLGAASASVAVTGLSNVTSFSLNVATAFTNSQAGTHTIRITEITPTTGNVAVYGTGNYPLENFVVNEAPEITW